MNNLLNPASVNKHLHTIPGQIQILHMQGLINLFQRARPALQHGRDFLTESLLLPPLFAIGTGLPVIIFAFILAFGVGKVGKMYNAMGKIEKVMRYSVATIFLARNGNRRSDPTHDF